MTHAHLSHLFFEVYSFMIYLQLRSLFINDDGYL